MFFLYKKSNELFHHLATRFVVTFFIKLTYALSLFINLTLIYSISLMHINLNTRSLSLPFSLVHFGGGW